MREPIPMGALVITAAAKATLCQEDVDACLRRHGQCDWGDLCAEDWQTNEVAFMQNHRLFSVYHDRNRVKFYIITEHDRSATTVLLPQDY